MDCQYERLSRQDEAVAGRNDWCRWDRCRREADGTDGRSREGEGFTSEASRRVRVSFTEIPRRVGTHVKREPRTTITKLFSEVQRRITETSEMRYKLQRRRLLSSRISSGIPTLVFRRWKRTYRRNKRRAKKRNRGKRIACISRNS